MIKCNIKINLLVWFVTCEAEWLQENNNVTV